MNVEQKWLHDEFMLPATITYFGPQVRCPILLSDFNQILIISTDIHKSLQDQILRKSVQWQPGHEETNTRFARRRKDALRRKVNQVRTLVNKIIFRMYLELIINPQLEKLI
jgi:hypothetical protein